MQKAASFTLYVIFFLAFSVAVTAQDTNRQVVSSSTSDWNYRDESQWKEHSASCGGHKQSPINLDIKTAIIVSCRKFHFGNYDKIYSEMVVNNGHTVEMKLDKNVTDVPFIEGGELPDRYNFVQLHFHWGRNKYGGSEHRIGNLQYPAELHMVHYNTKYGSFQDAIPHSDGLAVLAIMIELEARDNIAFRHLEHFDDIIKANENKTSPLPYTISLSDLLPDSTDSFYRYSGSLTTPGCNEDVTWTIFDTPIAISERQLDKFRQLLDAEGRPMQDNFRPIQELHNRIVLYCPH